MTIQRSHSTATNMILMLDNSKFDFYATGSRFFGGADEQSDYDYYAQFTPEILSWLREKNFDLHLDYNQLNQYNDLNTVYVMRYGMIFPTIDIQLVLDLELKHKAHDLYGTVRPFIDRETFKNHTRTLFWDRIYTYLAPEKSKEMKRKRLENLSGVCSTFDSLSVRGFK